MKILPLFGLLQCSIATAALDPKVGWDIAGYELTLQPDSAVVSFYQTGKETWRRDFKPHPGDTKLGYTYYSYADMNVWHDDRPGGSGWFRLVEEGRTRVWYDKKRDKQRQPEEIVEVPFKLWFEQRTQIYLSTFSDAHDPADLPRVDGSFPPALQYAEKNLLKNRQATPEPVPGLGDHAWITPDGTGTNGWLELTVVRGPIIFRTEIRPLLMIRAGAQFRDDPILRNVNGGFRAGDLAAYQIRPDDDSGLLDVTGIAARTPPRLREELLGIARDFVRDWDRYCAVKVGPGPHFKGLYLDAAALLPDASAIPGTRQTRITPNMWSSSVGFANAALPDAESLELELRTFGVVTSAPTADQPMINASAEFAELVSNHGKAAGQTTRALAIPGTDQCTAFEMKGEADGRTTYFTKAVIFRIGNVTGRVIHYCGVSRLEEKKLPVLPGDPAAILVSAVLAKAMRIGASEAVAAPAGPAFLTATADADRLWSDGASTTTLRFAAKLANGSPATALPLTVTVESPFVGDVATAELTSDAAGLAVVEYRAGNRAGPNKVSVRSGDLAATVELHHGGLETLVHTPGQQFLADGATPVVVAARLLDPDGKPVANAPIEAETDESELSAHGTLGPDPAEAGSRDGWQSFAYVPPAIDPASGWQGGRVSVTFKAVPAANARALKTSVPITLHSGSPFWITIVKPGFAPSPKTPFRSERRHGTVAGTAHAAAPAGEAPLAFAKVSVYAAVEGKERVIGSGITGPDGAFTVAFTLEKLVAGPESACTIEPAALTLAPEPQRWLEITRAKADTLIGKGCACAAAAAFAEKYIADLAASSQDPRDPRNTARLLIAVRLMGEALGYFDQLDNQHSQAEAWLIESLEAAVDDLAKIIDFSGRMETAQENLAADYASRKELAGLREQVDEAWGALRKQALTRFVATVYGVMRDVYKDTATGLKNRETLGLSNDSGVAGWKKWAKNKTDGAYAEWMFDPGSAIANWGEKQFKAKMLEFLKTIYRGEYPKFLAGAVDHAATHIAAGDFTWENPGNAAATLRDDFAAVAEAYRAANAAHLNRELTRLDLKLATDTVGKGVAIYVAGKEALNTDPAKFKKAVLDSIGNVDKGFAAFDTACQAYNGQQWFEVCHQARLAIADVAVDASR